MRLSSLVFTDPDCTTDIFHAAACNKRRDHRQCHWQVTSIIFNTLSCVSVPLLGDRGGERLSLSATLKPHLRFVHKTASGRTDGTSQHRCLARYPSQGARRSAGTQRVPAMAEGYTSPCGRGDSPWLASAANHAMPRGWGTHYGKGHHPRTGAPGPGRPVG